MVCAETWSWIKKICIYIIMLIRGHCTNYDQSATIFFFFFFFFFGGGVLRVIVECGADSGFSKKRAVLRVS